MTALPGRRRRSTIVAAVAAAGGVTVAIALTTLGAVTLYHSTEGADASSDRPVLQFPETPVGALGVVDDTGKLASIAVFVVQPAGAGGSIIPVPVSADASGGIGDERLPIAETVALEGTDALQRELEVALGLTIDDVTIVDAAGAAALLGPVGELEVDVPHDVTDSSGDVVAEAGESTLDASAAAAILAARDRSVPAVDQYPAASAVWAAVAAAIGDGVTPTTTEPAAAPRATTGSDLGTGFEELFGRILAGRVGERALRSHPVSADQNPRDVDVSVLDPAELALVFGEVAPGAVAAPSAGLSFRVESTFSDEQLAATGYTNTDVAYAAVQLLLAVGANVVSVSTAGDPPGATTSIDVADQTMTAATANTRTLFGDVTVGVDDQPIVGVDAVVTLGTDFLTALANGTTSVPVPSTSAPAPSSVATTEGSGG